LVDVKSAKGLRYKSEKNVIFFYSYFKTKNEINKISGIFEDN